jgi:hypothetical protein
MAAFRLSGIGTRYLFAFGLVCVTWNPTRFNYIAWAEAQWSALAPLVVFVGLVLLVGWIVFLRATARSLGPVGLVLAVALAASILWIIIDYRLINPDNRATLSWVVLTLIAAILAAGMSWSHLRRRWAGQADVDDVDEVA